MPSGQIREVVAYLVVGGTTAVIYYLLIYLLHDRLGAHYLAAVSIAYVSAVIFHFTANRNLTFGGGIGNTKIQAARYVLFVAFNLVVTLVVVYISVRYLALNLYLGMTLAILASLVIAYLSMKHWVFSAPQDGSE